MPPHLVPGPTVRPASCSEPVKVFSTFLAAWCPCRVVPILRSKPGLGMVQCFGAESQHYPTWLWKKQFANWKMVIEIVDVPINGVFPQLCNKLPEAIHKYPGSKKNTNFMSCSKTLRRHPQKKSLCLWAFPPKLIQMRLAKICARAYMLTRTRTNPCTSNTFRYILCINSPWRAVLKISKSNYPPMNPEPLS